MVNKIKKVSLVLLCGIMFGNSVTVEASPLSGVSGMSNGYKEISAFAKYLSSDLAYTSSSGYVLCSSLHEVGDELVSSQYFIKDLNSGLTLSTDTLRTYTVNVLSSNNDETQLAASICPVGTIQPALCKVPDNDKKLRSFVKAADVTSTVESQLRNVIGKLRAVTPTYSEEDDSFNFICDVGPVKALDGSTPAETITAQYNPDTKYMYMLVTIPETTEKKAETVEYTVTLSDDSATFGYLPSQASNTSNDTTVITTAYAELMKGN